MSEPARRYGINAAVLRDSVEALYEHRPQALVVGLAFLGIFLWVFRDLVDPVALVLWSVGMVLMTVNGLYWLKDFRRVRPLNGHDARRHLRLYTGQAWLAGLLFGCAGWLFYSPEFGESRWLVVLLLCSLAAGTVTVYAHHVPTYLGFLVLLNGPLALRFMYSGAPGGWVAYAMMVFYVAMLARFAQRQGRALTEALRVRHENAALVQLLEEKTRALERANEGKTRFFAAASHDLRQPLQALGYYAGLLEPRTQDVTHVQRIQECVDSLDGLLEGVLTISRLDAGKVPSHLQPVDLEALLQRLVTLYDGVASAKGLQLRSRVSRARGTSSSALWARTDPLLLERVMGNLLGNALRYTFRGGVILVARQGAQGIRLQVADTGIGIAAPDQERIFDEFVQLNNPHRGEAQGVGLGLATVRRICRLLEHPMQLRSIPGRGSVFTIILPAAAAPPPPEAVPADPAPDSAGRILLVEDNRLVRESLQQSLIHWGWQVEAFADVRQATLGMSAGRFDAALSDWRLPGDQTGLDLLRHPLLQDPRCLRLLMTGETAETLGEPGTGITLLTKPVRPLRLRALLSAHLQGAGRIAGQPLSKDAAGG